VEDAGLTAMLEKNWTNQATRKRLSAMASDWSSRTVTDDALESSPMTRMDITLPTSPKRQTGLAPIVLMAKENGEI